MASAPSVTAEVVVNTRGVEKPLSLWQGLAFPVTRALLVGLLSVLGLRGLYRFGRGFGTLEWLINYKRRRRFADVLARVSVEKPTPSQRRRATRDFFVHTRCDKIFYLIIDALPADRAASLLSVGNKHLLDDALAGGNGAYVAMSHHGPLHVCAMLLSLHGYTITAVRDRREGAIRRYVQARFDKRHPDLPRARMLFADGFPREIYRCFKDNLIVASTMDVSRRRQPGQAVEMLSVFGDDRPFLAGPLRIARRCGAPAIQAFMYGEPDFRYRLEFVEIILDPDEPGDEPTLVKRALRAYAANVESCFRASPSRLTRI